ncbi:MAG: prepilin-type N-terminal cleavage/methylation domain-containing protein [Deferribacteres bacterium]|nr:prepilin-type N-terminal cleavage/methylation domain-containing protein [Deferribacteres bacterium]
MKLIKEKTRTGKQRQMKCSGFTLVEVMIAMVVLLVGMIGVMSMQYFSVRGNAASRELRIATSLSQQVLENLRATPYANLSSTTDEQPPKGVAISGNVQFTRAWWVVPDCVGLADNGDTCTANTPAPACISDPDATVIVPVSVIRVRTCWSDRNGVNHSVTLDTIRWDENATP